MQNILLTIALLAMGATALPSAAMAQEDAPEPSPEEPATPAESADGVKTMSGMSVLGNEEAPKSLVIVPWKSSKLGDGLGVTNSLDQSPRAVDKEVFMRELRYYALRSGDIE